MTAFLHLVSCATFARLLYNAFQHNSKASLEIKEYNSVHSYYKKMPARAP